LVPAGNLLSGSISFDPGDPTNFDYDRNQVTAFDSLWNNYGARVEQNGQYYLPVPDGKYNVNFDPEVNNYLVMPAQYENIMVTQDTLDTLDFHLNYAHASLTVKLKNAPVPNWFNGYAINTKGNWPNVYSAWAELQPDSTIHLNLCEGEWQLFIPFWDPSYSVYPNDTTLVITESDSNFYVEFVYELNTGLEAADAVPNRFYLHQNYPNPFNPVTTIEYGLAKAGKVKIAVFNILGEKIQTLVDTNQKAGRYHYSWKPENLASGIYIYRLETEGFVSSKKLILIK